jgi:cytochrome c2
MKTKMATPSRSLGIQVAWHVLAIAALACLPLLKFELPWWDVQDAELISLAYLLGAYAASALAVMLFVDTEGRQAAGRALLIVLSMFGLVLLWLSLMLCRVPRYQLLPIFLTAVVLLPLSVFGRPTARVGLAVLAVAAIGFAGFSTRQVLGSAHRMPSVAHTEMTTAFYALRVVVHSNEIPRPATRGGGLDRVGDRVLLGTGDGHLYLLRFGAADALKVDELPTQVPANREEFATVFGGSSRAPLHSSGYVEDGSGQIQTWRFRVADVIAQTTDTEVRIFASHHFWKAQEQCFVVRVSDIAVPLSTFPQSLREAHWQTLYETEPCVPITGKVRKRGKNPFHGEESGGRLALIDDHTLLLTLGDHEFYGGGSVQAFAQDPRASYGKTIRIDLGSRSARMYTLGHRNPQGLFVAKDGRIWSTEHGPRGGDELNVLVEGANYGWPLVTYGTDYGAFDWKDNPRQGHHDGFTEPVYAFVPSIGITSLIMMERDLLGTWKGNLLVGSLATRSLYRLTLDGDRVVVDEPISIGRRVRDLLEMDDGRLLLWTDDGALVTLEPTSEMSGATAFGMQCSGCHQIADGQSHRIGPDLYGVLGRKIAGADGFDDYSPAMQRLGGEWTRERLDAFLRDPQAFAPGTTMAFEGIPDDAQRAALIDHIQLVCAPGGLKLLVSPCRGSRPCDRLMPRSPC